MSDNQAHSEQQPGSGWTWPLAGIIGLAGVLFLSFFIHWYEAIVFADIGPGNRQVAGNSLSLFIVFLLLALMIPLNAALGRWCPRFRFNRAQLTLMMSLWLLTGAIVFAYLIAPVLHTIAEFNNVAYVRTASRQAAIAASLPQALFLAPEAAQVYFHGLSETSTYISFSRVPWSLWLRPLAFWIPFMLCVIVCAMALVRMVHRQWANHELLTYPLAEFMDSMLTPAPGGVWPAMFYNPVFWCGFAVTGFIFLLAGLQLWMPQMISVPLDFAHYDLVKEFPYLNKYCGSEAYSLFRGWVYITVVAVAVLLPAEISLTAWAGWVLLILATGGYFLLTGEAIGRAETTYINYGSFIAMLAMLIFIGRKEYGAILRHALATRIRDPELRAAVWACRIFLAASMALLVLLHVAGFSWFQGVLLVASLALVVLLAARMTAEMGCPWLPNLSGLPQNLSMTFLSATALGTKGLALFYIIGALLAVDMSNSVAAQETTISRLRDRLHIKIPRVFHLIVALGIGLTIVGGIAFNLWDNYSVGAQRESVAGGTLRNGFATVVKEMDRMQAQHIKTDSGAVAGTRGEWGLKVPDRFGRFFIIGAALVGGCALMRLRCTWWPFHPLPLLFFGTWTMGRLYLSFLIGWLIKVTLLKIGGGSVFMRMKPFFIGLVLGQAAMIGVWIIVNVGYYLVMHAGAMDTYVRFTM